ncbi:MAG: TetR family transcriptional regulator [Flavobacteriaceae bacterium]|nr:MAG: TetR family transcriptional regulator [Flavobacteriaceae bacterium]
MKEPILKKSCDLFLKFGYKCITMDDIANALAISKKTLYKCFKNKNELVEASTAFFHSQIFEMISNIHKQQHNAIKENFEITTIFKDIFTETMELPMFQLNKYYPETYKKFIENEFRIFENFMRDNLKRGLSEGLYRKDLDIDGIVKYYFILVMNIHEHQIFKKDTPSSHEFPILEYHTRAIATAKGLIELEKQLLKKQ